MLVSAEDISVCGTLNKISCSFSYGNTIILGPNGSGKPNLLQVLAGVIAPTTGQVTIDGNMADRPTLRRNIGYLPQTFGLYPQLTAQEMLDYIAILKGINDQKAREHHVASALERTGLVAVAKRKVGVFSRGMKQKVGIAQALLGNPPILILDEPTAGLDPEERNKLRAMLMELGQESVVVWVSSLISDANYADRILIMEQGANCFWGTPSELVDRGIRCSKASYSNPLVQNDCLEQLEQGYRSILCSRGRT